MQWFSVEEIMLLSSSYPGQLNASSSLDYYLGPTQFSTLSPDSIGSQSGGSSVTTSSDPTWFAQLGSYESSFPPDPMDVSITAGSMGIGPGGDVSAHLLVSSSQESYRESIHTDMASTALSDAVYDFGSSVLWDPTITAPSLDSISCTYNVANEDSERALPGQMMSPEADKLFLPLSTPFKCHACENLYASESSLGEHQLKSHPLNRFSCDMCAKKFKLKKDLNRHKSTHAPLKSRYACSCQKTYARKDGLLRHLDNMTARGDLDPHSAAESLPRQ